MKYFGPSIALVALLALSLTGCSRSHLLTNDAGSGVRDAGDYIPGLPDARADRDVWYGYCVRILPLLDSGTHDQAVTSCDAVIYDLSCDVSVGQLNHCLDVARSLYMGENLDITMIPECHSLCPHPDGG